MLTDLFARRYERQVIWPEVTEPGLRLMVQAWGVAKDVMPWPGEKDYGRTAAEAKWQSIHDRVARELGRHQLWDKYYSYQYDGFQGVKHKQTITNTPFARCEMFATLAFTPALHGRFDWYMKDRLSLVELVLRLRAEEINAANASLQQKIDEAKLSFSQKTTGIRIPFDESTYRKANASINRSFNDAIHELNTRFAQTQTPLVFNGFIQLASDPVIDAQVAKPFWEAIANPIWHNVALDLNEAIDRRDSGAGDAAWFASRALESAIKIISSNKGWTTGTENGAHAFIDHLVAKPNGRFIEPFESNVLKAYFTNVRNSFGHGPGIDPMPNLTKEQTDWTIEFAMSWVRTLVRRL